VLARRALTPRVLHAFNARVPPMRQRRINRD
jgi:hypothetical protein